jgi:hypothetical protein
VDDDGLALFRVIDAVARDKDFDLHFAMALSPDETQRNQRVRGAVSPSLLSLA